MRQRILSFALETGLQARRNFVLPTVIALEPAAAVATSGQETGWAEA